MSGLPKPRTTTSVRFRPELYEALAAAAAERGLRINWLINKAVEEFLPRLLPADEVRWTRDDP